MEGERCVEGQVRGEEKTKGGYRMKTVDERRRGRQCGVVCKSKYQARKAEVTRRGGGGTKIREAGETQRYLGKVPR